MLVRGATAVVTIVKFVSKMVSYDNGSTYSFDDQMIIYEILSSKNVFSKVVICE